MNTNTNKNHAFIHDFERNQPVSSMALAYVIDKGQAVVSKSTEEEFSAAIDAAIEATEKNGGFYPMTKDFAMGMFRYAKKLAAMDPIQLVTLIGNGVYRSNYMLSMYGSLGEEFSVTCPACDGAVLFQDEDDESGNTLVCAKCGKKFVVNKVPVGIVVE